VFDMRLRFRGPVSAAPTLGDPRIFGLAVLAFVGLVIAAGILAGIIDAHGLGLGLMALGPVASVDLREQALAKFLEAKALEDESGTIAAEDQERYDALVAEGMALDGQVAEASKREGVQQSVRDRIDFYQGKATGNPMRWAATELDPRARQSLGEQFVGSESYKKLVASGALSSPRAAFRTDPVTLFAPRGISAATTDVIHTETGGSAAPQAIRLPGVYAYGRPPLNVRNLFPNESLASDSLEYVQQTAQEPASGSLAVKQSTAADDAAGLKKQSSAKWEVQTAYAETLATWFATTRQALAQPDGIRSFIDNQGRLFLAIEEEDQFINGNGTRPNLSGILDQSAILTHTPTDNLDGIRRARRLVKSGLSRLPASFLIVHPADSEQFDLLKDDFGQYRGGNPIGNFTFDQPIWGLTRVESEAVAEGTAIVGSGVGATVFDRQPPTVLTADQHSDFFVRNLVVILFEERVAFPIYFPTAFCEVTLAAWAAGS